MKEKIQQKGFIQIPILLGILVFGAIATIGVIKHEEIKSAAANIFELIPAKIIEIGEITKERPEESEAVENVPEPNQSNQEAEEPEVRDQGLTSQEVERLKKEAEEAKIEAERLRREKEEAEAEAESIRKQAQEELKKLEDQRTQKETTQLPNSILCNGQYWPLCSSGHWFHCPQKGNPMCCPSNSVMCNDKCWLPCEAGQKFECPSTGNAKCIIEENKEEIAREQELERQKQQLESELQKLSNLLANQLNDYNSQLNSLNEQIMAKRNEIDAIIAEYDEKIEKARNRLESMSFIYGEIANLNYEKNRKLNPLYRELQSLIDQYNMLTGNPLSVAVPQELPTFPKLLHFYPDSIGGGDLYDVSGSVHLKVVKTGSGYRIYYNY